MTKVREVIYGKVKVVERCLEYPNYEFGLEDLDGNVIVPYGKYGRICRFDKGYARVKSIDRIRKHTIQHDNFEETIEEYPKWGIINEKGELVVPMEYDEIWELKEGYRRMVMVKFIVPEDKSGSRKLKTTGYDKDKLYKYFDITDGKIYSQSQNIVPRQRTSHIDFEPQHYEEYADSYAQDEMGYSDEEINDAFDGDPEAYWNID